jgi:membrane fusion protein (multidrug efflux system)
VVEGGLADGERVIIAGTQKVQPGATVRPVEAPATAQASAAPQAPNTTTAAN